MSKMKKEKNNFLYLTEFYIIMIFYFKDFFLQQ